MNNSPRSGALQLPRCFYCIVLHLVTSVNIIETSSVALSYQYSLLQFVALMIKDGGCAVHELELTDISWQPGGGAT